MEFKSKDNKRFLTVKKTGFIYADFSKPIEKLIVCGKCFTDCKIGLFYKKGDKTKKNYFCKVKEAQTMTIKELKLGDFFTKKPIEYPTEKQVFIRGEYDRTTKKYEIVRFDDVNAVQYMSGDKEIFTDFIF